MDFHSNIEEQIVLEDWSIYSCYIIHDCSAMNLNIQSNGGCIKITKSNNALTMYNVLFYSCTSNGAAIGLCDNSITTDLTKICAFECKSNEKSFGKFSGNCNFTYITACKLGAIDYEKDNVALEYNSNSIYQSNINFTKSKGKYLILTQAKNSMVSKFVHFSRNTIVKETDTVGVYMKCPAVLNYSNFIENTISHCIASGSSDVVMDQIYFISNDKDIKSNQNMFIYNCYTNNYVSVSGLAYIGNVSYASYPSNIALFNSGYCQVESYTDNTILIPSPAPTLPKKCEEPPDDDKKHARRYNFVFYFAADCVF